MCGTANQVETVFCTNCGARLVPLTAEPDSEKPASVRAKILMDVVFGHAARDILFGTLILALVGTTIAGVIATLVVLYREAYLGRLQTEFVNKVSHDLRTPLTSIRMFVETLQMGRLPDDARRADRAEGRSTDKPPSGGYAYGAAWYSKYFPLPTR